MAGADRDPTEGEPPDIGDLYDELSELEGLVDTDEERAQVREAMALALAVDQRPIFGRIVKGFDLADSMEAFLGALLLGIPMFVESGTVEIGAFVATHPAYLVLTHLLGLALVVGILYVADIQDVRIQNPIFGLVPRRVVGVVGIAFGTALVMMTIWGRVDWVEPWVSFCTVSVAYVPMAIGASLGDIVPGT